MGKIIGKMFCAMTTAADQKRLRTQTLPTGAEKVAEECYTPDNHPLQRVSIYRPEGIEGLLPVIFDVHGGGWYYGDHNLNFHYDRTLAAQGYVVVGVGYRLAPEATYVDQLRDVAKALCYVAEHAPRFGIDLSRAFLTGDSAGGHLSSLLLRTTVDHDYRVSLQVDEVPVHIRAVCFTCGAHHPTNMAKIPLARAFFGSVIGKGYRRSPYYDLADFRLPEGLEGVPPMLFTSCYGDFLRKDVLQSFEETHSAGYDCRLLFREEQTNHKLGHVYNVLCPEWEESIETNQAMLDFFEESLLE